jgi:hypothetical protein
MSKETKPSLLKPPQIFKLYDFGLQDIGDTNQSISIEAAVRIAQAIFEKWYRTAMESLEDARAERTKRFNADPNEDFVCGKCGKEVWGRYLFCSTECSDEFDKGRGA